MSTFLAAARQTVFVFSFKDVFSLSLSFFSSGPVYPLLLNPDFLIAQRGRLLVNAIVL